MKIGDGKSFGVDLCNIVDLVGGKDKEIPCLHGINAVFGGILSGTAVYKGDFELGMGVFEEWTYLRGHVAGPHFNKRLSVCEKKFPNGSDHDRTFLS